LLRQSDFFIKSVKDANDIQRYINESKANQKKSLSKVQTSIEQDILKNFKDPFLKYLSTKANQKPKRSLMSANS